VDSSQVLWHFVGFYPVQWQFGEFQTGFSAVTWIQAEFYDILLDFTTRSNSLVNFNRVLLQLRGFQPSVMAFCWIFPGVMAA
jgi:hypothetical protein